MKMNRPVTLRIALAILALSLLGRPAPSRPFATQQSPAAVPSQTPSFAKTREFIAASWATLTRYPDRCETFVDPKAPTEPTLYFPAGAAINGVFAELPARCQMRIENLPVAIQSPGSLNPASLPTEGLLHLVHPYVVPGGRFNEMYGWDSYFIIRGLIADGHADVAKGMVENFFYEIENYGSVLNANRTYYLTRSQPPFLTSMILAVYDAEPDPAKRDTKWLARAYEFAQRDYEQWVAAPHLAGATGLSRYFDRGAGPAPEVLKEPENYYRGVANFMVEHPAEGAPYLTAIADKNAAHEGPIFEWSGTCGGPSAMPATTKACKPARVVVLTAGYYQGDRATRESGFDVSFRFGPYGGSTQDYAPVCLNSLLFKTENDLATIAAILEKPDDASKWRSAADARRKRIDRYLWDEKRGEYFDFNTATGKRSTYEYATTFYPLWAGLASKAQAKAVMENLSRFRRPGGLVMSEHETQLQWDAPFGWAPIQLLACEGMRRYGYTREADGVSYDFLTMIIENFARDATIREKYNVVTRDSRINALQGYHQNVIGFGWTNATFAILADQLSPAAAQILKAH
jgi:alpha,alpha-trehalase